MRWIAPVGIAFFVLIAILLLRGRGLNSPVSPEPPDAEAPSGIEGELGGSPEPTGVTAPPEGGPLSGPDVAGIVVDRSVCAQEGRTVEAVDSAGRVVAECVTGRHGEFAMEVPAVPPYILRVRGSDYHQVRITVTPTRSLRLLVETSRIRLETLYVKPVWDGVDDGKPLNVQLLDSRAEAIGTPRLYFADAPWRFEGMPFGTYAVRVWNKTWCGLAPRFEFTAEQRQVEVVLAASATIRATTTRPVRAMLIPRPPLGDPPARDELEQLGRAGRVRGFLHRTKEPAADIQITDVPAGEYSLVLTAPGCERVEMELAVAAGQVLDLGRIEIKKATGMVSFTLNDRNKKTTEYGYLLTVYTRLGEVLEVKTNPGDSSRVRIGGLGAGTWYYRVERKMGGGRLRAVGNDESFEVQPGEEARVEVDLTWRYEEVLFSKPK